MKHALIHVLWLSILAARAYAQDEAPALKIREGVKNRITTDIHDLRQVVEATKLSQTQRDGLLEDIAAAETAFLNEPGEYGDGFRAVLPLTGAHARLFGVQAALWRLQGYAPLTIWQADLWGNLGLWDPPKREGAAVAVHMMLNEYRAGAFNISNASPEAARISLRIEGMPGGANPACITVHQVEWTDTRTGRVVAAALPEAAREGDNYVIEVPSGMTRQVWLTFHPIDVAAGVHNGRIVLNAGGAQLETPLTLTLYPFRFPDQPALHSGGWDYTAAAGIYGVTDANLEAFLKHCRDHFVDSPWEGKKVIPEGTYDAQGNMASPPDTAAFDAWVKRWEGARRFCAFPNAGSSFAGFDVGTPQFENAVKAYAAFWANHMKELGLESSQLIWLLIDETSDLETDTLVVAWAKAIRAGETGIQIWEDPIHGDMSKAHPELGSVCHILCPNRTMFLRAPEKYARYFLEQRDKGVTLEFYSCRGPARLLDPYAYHRMQAWSCWQHQAISTNFWAWGDNAGVSSWNEYLAPRTAYTPFFIDAVSVTAGKHMEACRESIEDYEYLVMLARAVASAGKDRPDSEAARHARKLLVEIPGRVLNPATLDAFWWRDPLDRTTADTARLEILEALAALEK